MDLYLRQIAHRIDFREISYIEQAGHLPCNLVWFFYVLRFDVRSSRELQIGAIDTGMIVSWYRRAGYDFGERLQLAAMGAQGKVDAKKVRQIA